MTDNWTAEQRARYQRQRVRELYEWVDNIKASTPCADCDQIFPAICMDFDHVRGQKKMGIARMIGNRNSRAAIGEEMAKCDLVCANCHRIRTHRSERSKPWDENRRRYDYS